MGQTLRTMMNNGFNQTSKHHLSSHQKNLDKLPDLASWPPELSLNVLKNLNATDLCLASCVWNELAKDELLWQSLCYNQWPYTSIYQRIEPKIFSYHKLYLTLDEATVTFNADCRLGMDYFFKFNLIDNDPHEIAQLFFRSRSFDRAQIRRYLESDVRVLDQLIILFDFSNQTLPNALRQFFDVVEVPNRYDHFLHLMMDKFAIRYVQCNKHKLQHSAETIYVLCFSLIMLSADLFNPRIKNKMSKREFIRNVRRALGLFDDELFGHLYDDVYLRGHIAGKSLSHCYKTSGNHIHHRTDFLPKRYHLIR
ncbi:Prion protein-interacting protein [Sarcoptes scabiei]|nr:Prion protein-interacting protein [Sarcoptes scabiei]